MRLLNCVDAMRFKPVMYELAYFWAIVGNTNIAALHIYVAFCEEEADEEAILCIKRELIRNTRTIAITREWIHVAS
jgi:hypothetical protein